MHQVYYTHLEEEYTETYTRLYNGENRKFSSLHLQRMEHCSQFQALDPPFFLEFNPFPTSYSIFCFFVHSCTQCVHFVHTVAPVLPLHAPLLQNSTEAEMFFPFFVLFVILSLQTQRIEILHRPICF